MQKVIGMFKRVIATYVLIGWLSSRRFPRHMSR